MEESSGGLRHRREAAPAPVPEAAREAPPDKRSGEGGGGWRLVRMSLLSLVVAGVAGGCFWTTRDAELLFDDTVILGGISLFPLSAGGAIIDNADVTGGGQGLFATLPSVLRNDFWGNPMDISRHKSYRPLTILSFRADFVRSGHRLDARAFHTTNILLHALASALVVPFASTWVFCGESLRGPFVTALLFATHTVHCEAVAGVVGRGDVLSTLLVLLASLTYSRAAPAPPPRGAPPGGGLGLAGRVLWYATALALVLLAALSKETGLGACAVLPILECARGGVSPLTLSKASGARAWGFLARSCGLLAACAGVVLHRFWMTGGTSPQFQPQNNPAAFHRDWTVRFMTYWHTYSLNARLLLLPLPSHLSCDWSMGSVPLVERPSDPRNLPSLALLLVLAALCVWVAASSLAHFPSPASRGAARVLALLFIPFLPASNLFFTVGFVVAERVLYLPSLGFCALLALAVESLPALGAGRAGRAGGGGLAALLAAGYGAGALRRNGDWATSEKLFRSSLRATPGNAKLWHNLAHVSCESRRAQEGLMGKAELKACKGLYKKAVSLAPDFADAYSGYGILIGETQAERARQLLETAVRLEPQDKLGHKNLADLLARKRLDFESSKVYYENALRLDPTYADAHNNYGNTLLMGSDMAKVEHHYRQALRFNPHHPNALENIQRFFPAGGGGLGGQGGAAGGGKVSQKKRKEKDSQAGGGQHQSGADAVGKGGGGGGKKGKDRDKKKKKDKGRVGERQTGPNKDEDSARSGGGGQKEKLSVKADGSGTGEKGNGDGERDKGMASWGIAQYEEALQQGICAGSVEKNCLNNLGVLLFQQGRGHEALPHLQKAHQLDPTWAEAEYNLGYVRKNLQSKPKV